MLPSITIRIDYGSEGGEAARSSAAVTGSLPSPDISTFASSAGGAQATTGLPSPMDNAAQAMGSADTAAPSPSANLVSAAGAGGGGDMSNSGAPTPFSGPGFTTELAGKSGDGAPTPMQSAQTASAAGGGAPEPDTDKFPPSENRPTESSSNPEEGPARKGRR